MKARVLSVGAAIWLLSAAGAMATEAKGVIKTYADIAAAMYADSLQSAEALHQSVVAFTAAPTEENLQAARAAWVAARVPYQQTEGLRFGNSIVDEWEGRVNAWPLDEGLLDYVAPAYGDSSDENPAYTANLVANETLQLGGQTIDASVITKDLLSGSLHEVLGVEANVATGYHAIEFLLWGQDLNGTGPGAGARPATDFDPKNCSNGHCERRAALLNVLTGLLVDDLTEMADAWAPGGAARLALLEKTEAEGLVTILTGLGSLSYGELAGERIKLGLLLHDPEEEHDCFSDNTHNSHYYNQVGMVSLYTGSYRRIDGSAIQGPSMADFAGEKAPEAHQSLNALMVDTLARMQVMKDTADSGKMAYDQMIGEGNDAGNKIIRDVVDGLVAQTRGIERVVAALDLDISVEGSDSLDNEAAVQ
ncbi:MAG: imelysin family protein [Magnetospiraceae bacterium]